MRNLINPFAGICRRPNAGPMKTGACRRDARCAAIGIPRALFYFLYPGLWQTFFDSLGVPVVISAPTNRLTLERAGLISETEHCLPAKILDAHLDDLTGRTPRVFVPRVLSMCRGYIACPKLAALPDAVRAQFGDRFEVVTIDLDENKKPLESTLVALGKQLGFDTMVAANAARAALQGFKNKILSNPDKAEDDPATTGNEALTQSGRGKRFFLIGHPYNLDDAYLADPVRRTLADLGATVDRIDDNRVLRGEGSLKWDMCALMFEALKDLDPVTCAGVIQVTSFNCGCDSMAGLYYREILKQKGIPYMTLTLDTHTAQTGLETRLEAFVDSIGEYA